MIEIGVKNKSCCKSNIIWITILIFFVLSAGCNHKKYERRVVITSPDESQSITVITRNKTRFVINGHHRNVPDTNFVKLDISQISDLGDELGICWEIDNYQWRLVNHKSIVIESKLDTTTFDFKEELEKTENGIPTMKEYLYDNCVRIGINYNLGIRLGIENGYSITPKSGANISN